MSLVLCTAPEHEARALADALLHERLAACVNLLGPVVSRFWWEGKLDDAREMLLLIKTRSALVTALEQRIAELHSYAVPEVIELRVAAGWPPYLQWVLDSCQSRGDGP